MHLRSISLKGFKSFPDRTRLDFSPGVSVIVGPNGSGKSNITDAVLWALGEQSPLAVRGQTMQDVIFTGGQGQSSRRAAEVEVVIENSEGVLAPEFSDLSIVRRLDRSGEGEYRLNGARCRLVDVLEALSDTGLGKEMHSVVSQGRVEAIVHSKPADRRLLIEEAAGLGKHRKRRRRAELKLQRTEDNLSRALDVEREARSRLRPLKRQAEAAEVHERLERQQLEAGLALARDVAAETAAQLAEAESAAATARSERDEVDALLTEVAGRRERAEEAFAAHSGERERLAGALFSARAGVERIDMRLERARETADAAEADRGRLETELRRLTAARDEPAAEAGRVAELEAELAALGAGASGPGKPRLSAADEAAGAAGAVESARRAVAGAADLVARGDVSEAGDALARIDRSLGEAAERLARVQRLVERSAAAPSSGEDPDAVRRAELAAELAAERRHAEQLARADSRRDARVEQLRRSIDRQVELEIAAVSASGALETAREAVIVRRDAAAAELDADEARTRGTAQELRSCAREEAELQGRLRGASEAVTGAEVRAQQVRDAHAEAAGEVERLAARLGLELGTAAERLAEEERSDLEARLERLARRREQLGPVNPLAKAEYEDAVGHVEDLESQREDLEDAMRELQGLIRETDRRIRESFDRTFEKAARNFEEVAEHLFPGGRGRLRLVQADAPRPVIGGEEVAAEEDGEGDAGGAAQPAPGDPGVEVEVTPAGKSTRRLSLLSGGEKSLVALAFLFAVFLARPCPFYLLDEVEAALDDFNIDRFLQLVRRFSDRAQFIVVTHQKRTMDAADCLYGVTMGEGGVSKVVSRRLPPPEIVPAQVEGAEAAA